MRTPPAFPIVLCLLVAGCAAAARGDGAVEVSFSASSAPPAHRVSLPSLMEKEFDGGDLRLGEVLRETEDYVRYRISYRSGDLRVSGTMTAPRGEGPFPVIVLSHGYIDPAVYETGDGLRREQNYLARHGYVAVHPDYRNYAESDDDALNDARLRIGYVEDVINAVLAVKSSGLPILDADRVGLLGHSMGGGVALGTLTVAPDLVDAAVLFAPISGDAAKNYDRWLKDMPGVAAMIGILYGTPEANPGFWKNLSATSFLDRIETPVQIHHGDADPIVPLAWSADLDRALRAAGKSAEFHSYPGERHELIDAWQKAMERTTGFFEKNLTSPSA